MKVLYDDLLDKYYDENWQEIEGRPVVKNHSFSSDFETIDLIKKNKGGNQDVNYNSQQRIRNSKRKVGRIQK